MRALLLAACSLLVSAGIVAGENPFGFPVTTRTLVAEFASADEARAAELTVAPLYGAAPLAFSVRWDDTNARHPKKAEMMNLPPAGKRAVRIGSVGPDGTHAAFPGLAVRLSLDSDGQVATVEIANGGKTALEGGWAVLFASPEHPDAGRIVLDVGELASGASFVRRVDLGRRVPELLTADERPLAVLQYDFATAEGSARLWTTSVVATAAGE